MKLKNPLAAAAAWAERMSDPEAAKAKQREDSQQRREQEAVQPPVPEAESPAEAAPVPTVPPKAQKKTRDPDELRSAVWAGCIMLGVISSVAAFFLGMIR